jgi:hypothetical protein
VFDALSRAAWIGHTKMPCGQWRAARSGGRHHHVSGEQTRRRHPTGARVPTDPASSSIRRARPSACGSRRHKTLVSSHNRLLRGRRDGSKEDPDTGHDDPPTRAGSQRDSVRPLDEQAQSGIQSMRRAPAARRAVTAADLHLLIGDSHLRRATVRSSIATSRSSATRTKRLGVAPDCR